MAAYLQVSLDKVPPAGERPIQSLLGEAGEGALQGHPVVVALFSSASPSPDDMSAPGLAQLR